MPCTATPIEERGEAAGGVLGTVAPAGGTEGVEGGGGVADMITLAKKRAKI